MNIAYPFGIGDTGRTLDAASDDHVRQMIEQLLLTSPGERVNRPQFGGGLRQLVFAPNSAALASALEFTLQASLQEYLGDLIEVRRLDVVSVDATISVGVQYIHRRSGLASSAQVAIPAQP